MFRRRTGLSAKREQPCQHTTVRKNWLLSHFECQVEGIGGPGARHVFRLERIAESGRFISIVNGILVD